MTKLFASDFDGTLHFWDRPDPLIAPYDMDAIAAFRKAGGLFGVCTGRALKSLTAQTQGHLDFDFYITISGAALFDTNCQLIWQRTLPKDVLREIYERYAAQLAPKEFQVVVAADDYWVLGDTQTSFPIARLESFDEVPGPYSGFSIETVTEEAASAYAADINERYGDVVAAHQNLNSVDVVPAGCTKGSGLAHIVEHYGAALSAGIGDSYNDLPLLEAADVAYTFNRAAQDVRTEADVLVDHASEAIYDFMERA